MEATLHALGEIFVQALPTFFLVLFLFLYLRALFFKPLEKVLAERNEATAGARKKASEALERANAKAAAYRSKSALLATKFIESRKKCGGNGARNRVRKWLRRVSMPESR